MILLNIDVTKIPKEAIASNPKWKGKFLKLKLVDSPKEDNDGFIAVDIPKEARDRGERGAIVGNYKIIGTGQQKPAQAPPRQAPRPSVDPDLDPADDDPDSLPF